MEMSRYDLNVEMFVYLAIDLVSILLKKVKTSLLCWQDYYLSIVNKVTS